MGSLFDGYWLGYADWLRGPFARVAWEFESKDEQRYVSASSVTLGGDYSVLTIKPDRDHVSYLVGAAPDLGGVTGYLTGSATSGRSSGDEYGVTLGVRAPF